MSAGGKKPAHLSTMSNRLTEMAVTIIGTNTETGKIMVRDSYGNEFEVNGSLRRKGTGFPQPNERWFLVKRSNAWVPDIQIGAPAIPTITGARDGLHPVMGQILDMLAEQGLVWDQTVSPLVVPPADPAPPDTPDPNAGNIDPQHDPSTDPSPEEIPPDTNGPTAPTPPPVDTPLPNPTPGAALWTPLYLVTYNTLKDVGPAGAYADLLRLGQTTAQVMMLQEAHADERDGGFQRLATQGWDYYRPKQGTYSDENTILWRSDQFTLMDQGSITIGHYSVPPFHAMPTRYLNWVKLLYIDANRPIYVMDTHLDPHLEYRGVPRYDWEYAVGRLTANFAMMATIAEKMAEFGSMAPVFTGGDWNIDAIADYRERDPAFPAARFGAVATVSNWSAITHRPKYGTAGSRYIDQIFGTRLPHWNVRAVDQWILTGYRSDHRPALVQYSIRSK